MLAHITQTVMKASFVQNRKTKVAIGHLFALLTLLTMVRVLMELGEETLPNQMDTGSSIHMVTLDPGSVMMAKQVVNGLMMMDPPQLELGGSRVTALGSELLPLMNLMKQSSMIVPIMRNTCASISITEKSTLKDIPVSGTGKHMESVTT